MKKKIIIVDDEKEIGEIISEYLIEKNYEVFYYNNAKSVIDHLNNSPVDLVITDMIMPEMNGLELTDYIYHNHKEVKVLACSGGGESGKFIAGMALDQALEEGADNAILKPFSKEEIVTKVKNLIGE